MCKLCSFVEGQRDITSDNGEILRALGNLIQGWHRPLRDEEQEHYLTLVDELIGFSEPENQEDPSGLMQEDE